MTNNIDYNAVNRWQNIAPTFTPWLHEEIANRMFERLNWINLQPKIWCNWQAIRGSLNIHNLINKKYKNSKSFIVELDLKAQKEAEKNWNKNICLFPDNNSLEMIWSNMNLNIQIDPLELFNQWYNLLKINGFIMFSCFGSFTINELENIYSENNWNKPKHNFVDFHDLGDILLTAKFDDPVIDKEIINLTFKTPERAILELRELGRNFNNNRFKFLRGKQWRKKLFNELEKLKINNKINEINLSFEIIYGHAIKLAPKLNVNLESKISLENLKAILKS